MAANNESARGESEGRSCSRCRRITFASRTALAIWNQPCRSLAPRLIAHFIPLFRLERLGIGLEGTSHAPDRAADSTPAGIRRCAGAARASRDPSRLRRSACRPSRPWTRTSEPGRFLRAEEEIDGRSWGLPSVCNRSFPPPPRFLRIQGRSRPALGPGSEGAECDDSPTSNRDERSE